MRYFFQFCFLMALLCTPGLALSVDLDQDTTLKATWSGETLFEAAPVSEDDLKRLRAWLESSPSDVEVVVEGNRLRGLPVELTVSSGVAKKWKSEPKTLAKLFAERLNRALGKSTPDWSVSQQVVPLSESRVVTLSPFRPQDGLVVESSQPTVADIEDLGNGRYRVNGRQRGGAKLLVSSSRGLQVSSLPIWVKPWAARWGDGPGRLSYWGPVTEERVSESLTRWLGARTLLGAEMSDFSVRKSEDGTFSGKARATAEGALPVEVSFDFEAVSRGASAFPESKVVVLSNHPERIISDGVLFERQVEAGPFRFMWHHRNDPEGPERYLVLQLSNPTSTTRRLRVLWHSFGPSPDEIHVGHTAALEYAKAGAEGWGEEIVLPANGTRTVEIRRVKPGQTMSGMAWIGDMNGSSGPMQVNVLATVGDGPLPTEPASNRDPGRTASGVFPAVIETDASHLLGGPFTYLEFGSEPYEKDVVHGHPSYGNFGTLYRTRLMLKNPSDEVADAVIGFASGGGAARGVLAVDGAIYDLPMGTTGQGIPVQTLTLLPGEVRQVNLELFPQAGSNYPVRVVVRSDFKRLEKERVEPANSFRPYIP